MTQMPHAAIRVPAGIAGVAAVTFIGRVVLPVNATTVGFAYILLILVIASSWGFLEAALASVAATFAFNYFFLPPVGTLTIADPENWVALFSLLATSLLASQLSTKARRRAAEALERQADLESLYTFSRAILLIDDAEPFAKQLVRKLADVFQFDAVVLYDRRGNEVYRAGPSDFEGLEDQLHDAARHGNSFTDPTGQRVIAAVRLGSDPIGSIALQGGRKQDSVVQGIANLVAIGLERARAQELGHEVEAARRSEQLRTTLIDAMAHEFKTPLTSIKAATTALLSDPGQPSAELLHVADEEADHLRELIDDAIEMARLDSAHIELALDPFDLRQLAAEVAASMRPEFDGKEVRIESQGDTRTQVDRRLVKLAIKQILDNARKYSTGCESIRVVVDGSVETVLISVTDAGPGIPPADQARIFDRFFRGPGWKQQVPGSGLGLSIARSILIAHGGDLSVTSQPGETTFQMRFPRR